MEFKKDVAVTTVDGDKVGEVERVVMDPYTLEVTHLIVRKGFLLTEDRVLPMSWVETATAERVQLRANANHFESLPLYEEQHFVPVSGSELERFRERVDYLAPMAYAPYYYYPPLYAVATERNIPEGTVALQEGARMISADDQQVGHVAEVFTDPETGRVTHFVASKGLFLKERKLIPYHWVYKIEEDRVHLAVQADFVKRLPRYEPAEEPVLEQR